MGDCDSSVRSGTSAANSALSSSRIMKVRTLNESLVPRTEQQRDAARIRRKLRRSSLNSDICSTDSESSFSVSFDTVEVREYPIILGDNPAVSEGPPLTIDWDYDNVDEFGLDEYETTRPPRRGTVEMNIPANIRVDCLKRCGFSTKEIFKRVKEVKLVRRARLQTTTMLYRSDMDEKLEKTKRVVTGFFSKKKKKERELMRSSKISLQIQHVEANNAAIREEEALTALILANTETNTDTDDSVGSNNKECVTGIPQ